MARRIEHRSTTEWPAASVYQALCDIEHLRARLTQLGGSRASLVTHEAGDDGVHFQVRHGISIDDLPTVARNMVGEDLTIDRTESWRPVENGYAGELAAEVAGLPCSVTGSMWLRDLATPTTQEAGEFVVSGEVRVNLPLFASKLEQLATDQFQTLLAAEERFTAAWLTQHE